MPEDEKTRCIYLYLANITSWILPRLPFQKSSSSAALHIYVLYIYVSYVYTHVHIYMHAYVHV